jgi:CubicO group peptidase (beta-lactamase class C family)
VSQQGSAQGLRLNYSIFKNYLESLRQQAAIPGISAAIVQDQSIVWFAGLGKANIEANVLPGIDTPYVLGSASQVFASTLLIEKCSDTGVLTNGIFDPVAAWADFPDTTSTIAHLLTHTLPSGVFRYDLARYGALTQVIERCTMVPYRKLLASALFDPLHMVDSVPGQALASPTPEDLLLFDAGTLNRYAWTVSQLAVPYRVTGSGTAIRSDFAGQPLNASGGVITTVQDLVRFDNALNAGSLLSPLAMNATFTPSLVNDVPLPTGLGWFVQYYNGDPRKRVVWQFGMVKDAYSSLILKLPEYKVTLILLANSDGLSAPFALENGDITTSPFARIFFRIFGL